MAQQYLEDPEWQSSEALDSFSMRVGEGAIEVLAEHGLVSVEPSQACFGKGTQAGYELLESD